MGNYFGAAFGLAITYDWQAVYSLLQGWLS